MTFQEFINRCEMYPYSKEYFEITKLASELKLKHIFLESYEYISEYSNMLELVGAGYFCENVSNDNLYKEVYDSYTEGVEKFFSSIIKKIQYCWNVFVNFLKKWKIRIQEDLRTTKLRFSNGRKAKEQTNENTEELKSRLNNILKLYDEGIYVKTIFDDNHLDIQKQNTIYLEGKTYDPNNFEFTIMEKLIGFNMDKTQLDKFNYGILPFIFSDNIKLVSDKKFPFFSNSDDIYQCFQLSSSLLDAYKGLDISKINKELDKFMNEVNRLYDKSEQLLLIQFVPDSHKDNIDVFDHISDLLDVIFFKYEKKLISNKKIDFLKSSEIYSRLSNIMSNTMTLYDSIYNKRDRLKREVLFIFDHYIYD